MKKLLTAAVVATALASPARAADEVVILRHVEHFAEAATAQADAWARWAEDFSRDMRASMGTMFGARVSSARIVKDAPYSAEVVTESNQALTDGNVITRKSSGAVFRDSQGRTRQESGGDGKARSIYISDPVEGRSIVLSPGAKHAVVIPRLALGPKVSVKTIDPTESGDGTRREEVRIQVVRTVDGETRELVMPVPPVPPVPPIAPSPGMSPLAPLPPIPPLPGASTMRFDSVAKLGKGVTTSLGQKDFDGVKAEGKSTVWTIPAGQIGNRNPIQVTSESWYSPELQLTVYSRYNDPRQGESIYRLSAIKRAEPAAELFKVPEGYNEKSRPGRDKREGRG